MFVADSLYGGTALPDWVSSLLLTPEVQRLRGIRLINSSSPSLAELSDARRYTHTLGVVRLALASMAAQGASVSQTGLLVSAAICHDLGTPPFGHLFEYLLRAMTGWSHEFAVQSILEGTYRPEKQYHQIIKGRQLALGKTLASLDIDPLVVSEIARGRGSLGCLISGSLDLDNVDNVFRMAHLLGLPTEAGGESAIGLAGHLRAEDDRLSIERGGIEMVHRWIKTRRLVYEVLAFDETNLKGQAMLTDCLTAALKSEEIHDDHWFWTDEWLLYKLEGFEDTKDLAERFISGDLYETVFIGWYDVGRGETDWRHPDRRSELENALSTELGLPCSPYVFYDSGTFSKHLDLMLSGGGTIDDLVETTTSQSSIVAVFTPRRRVPQSAAAGARKVLEQFGFPISSLQPIPDKRGLYGLPGQVSLPV